MHILIDAQGGVRCVYSETVDLAQLGHMTISRGSHVEPDAVKPDSLSICQSDAQRGLYAQAMAGYLRWRLIQVRGDVALLPQGGETLGESLAALTAKDLVIIFGFRRRAAEVPKTLALVKKKGAKILYFADHNPGAGDLADWTVRCPIRGADALDRYAGAMSLLHFYAMGVMRKMGAKGRARLVEIEQAHEALHAFG